MTSLINYSTLSISSVFFFYNLHLNNRVVYTKIYLVLMDVKGDFYEKCYSESKSG